MLERVTFSDLLAPLPAETFFESHLARQWVHIEGEAGRFGELLSWEKFNELLGMTSKWSPSTMQLFIEGRAIPADQYCEPSSDMSAAGQLRPVPPKVMALLKQGAALVANEMDSLVPSVAGIADSIEEELGTKAHCNLYCTWRAFKGFVTHFDVHDVYVVQVHGEKLWNIYENCVDAPVEHSRFRRGGRTYDEGGPGPLAKQLVMRPGDVLYLPRGQYHDAVSLSGASLHLTFGTLAFTGMDFLQTLMVQAVYDPLFRRNFPRAADGGTALHDHLSSLAGRIRSIVADPDFVERFGAYQETLRTHRGGYALPVELELPVFRVTDASANVERTETGLFLVGQGGRVEIPPEVEAPIRWIIETGTFTQADLIENNAGMAPDACAALISNLIGMRVVEQE